MQTWNTAGKLYTHSLKKYQNLTREQFFTVQKDLLYKTYQDAIKNVPYYKQHSRYPQHLQKDLFLEEFSKLPVLEKQSVKQDSLSFCRTPKSPFLVSHTTGGTTGSPLEIFQTHLETVKTNGLVQSTREKFCKVKSPRVLNITSSLVGDQITLELPFVKRAHLSIYQLNSKNRHEIEGLLRSFKPQLIHGYPSALAQLALLFPEGLPYELPNALIRCVSTSETLFPDTRKLIEKNLGVVVHNEYGSREGQHYVFECEHGGMHIHPARGYVEILDFDSDLPVAPGEAGRVVVTGFQNRHMPLIRYSIGDSANKASDADGCACGCEWPMLEHVLGRTDDLVRTRDGSRIGLIASSTVRTVRGIRESQVIQTGYEAFTYRIVTTASYDRVEAENEIDRRLSERLGYPVEINFEYVDTIEKTSSGKHRAVIVDFTSFE